MLMKAADQINSKKELRSNQIFPGGQVSKPESLKAFQFQFQNLEWNHAIVHSLLASHPQFNILDFAVGKLTETQNVRVVTNHETGKSLKLKERSIQVLQILKKDRYSVIDLE